MNVLLYSLSGEGAALHQKLFKEEGHDVIYYIENEGSRPCGQGIFFQTDDPDSVAAQADLIIFDDNGAGDVADRYRKLGYAVWNGGSFQDRLEHDRLYGMEVCRKYGIPIPDTFEVRSVEDVKAVLAAEFRPKEKVVIKLDGEDKAGSSFSFVARDAQECEEQVAHWEEEGQLGRKWSGIVQRFVKGIEVSTEAWFDPEHGFTTHNITLEEKKSLTGDLGQAIGCAFNTIVRIDGESRLFKTMLEPVAPLLREVGFYGQIDMNAIVDEDGEPYGLEWTPRCGYDATPTLAWGNNHGYGNKIAMLLGLMEPKEGELMFGYKGLVWAGVRVWVPPYPVECEDSLYRPLYEGCHGVPIHGLEGLEQDFYLYDVQKGENGLCCAGTMGMIGVAMGGGDDPRQAGLAAYRVAERLKIPNKSYRAVDGYRRAQDALPRLLDMGLIRYYRHLRGLQAA